MNEMILMNNHDKQNLTMSLTKEQYDFYKKVAAQVGEENRSESIAMSIVAMNPFDRNMMLLYLKRSNSFIFEDVFYLLNKNRAIQ